MNKVKVEICCGTACYLLGASKMMNLEESMSEEERACVSIEPKGCLELCERENLGGAPYVRFNEEEIMSCATPEKVLNRIKELIAAE